MNTLLYSYWGGKFCVCIVNALSVGLNYKFLPIKVKRESAKGPHSKLLRGEEKKAQKKCKSSCLHKVSILNFLGISSHLILIIFLRLFSQTSLWQKTKSSLVKWNFFRWNKFLSEWRRWETTSIIRARKMWNLCDVLERHRSRFTTFMHEILSLSFLFFCFSPTKVYATGKKRIILPHASPTIFIGLSPYVKYWSFIAITLTFFQRHLCMLYEFQQILWLWFFAYFRNSVKFVLLHSCFWSLSYIFIYHKRMYWKEIELSSTERSHIWLTQKKKEFYKFAKNEGNRRRMMLSFN